MSISKRFRDIASEVARFRTTLNGCDAEAEQGLRTVKKANRTLQEWVEAVGEVPQVKLEFKLTPVLLKAHNEIDRARLLFEESELEEQATTAWDLQQKIYRLLNDL
ncbi:MAG: hypothetical protein OET90_01970 [Desulfuromonadales bacterium]|nr:hypothetical protein [Desulfuromonadales bacterium]